MRQRGIADGWLTLVVLAVIAVGLWYAYQTIDKRGYERGRLEVQVKFDAFTATIKAQGEAAKKAAKLQEDEDKKAKEKADAENAKSRKTLADLAAAYRSLRDQRAKSGYLPAPEAGSKRPERAAINRAEFNRAMEYLDERGQGIAEEGDRYRIDLDTAKEWAK